MKAKLETVTIAGAFKRIKGVSDRDIKEEIRYQLMQLCSPPSWGGLVRFKVLKITIEKGEGL